MVFYNVTHWKKAANTSRTLGWFSPTTDISFGLVYCKNRTLVVLTRKKNSFRGRRTHDDILRKSEGKVFVSYALKHWHFPLVNRPVELLFIVLKEPTFISVCIKFHTFIKLNIWWFFFFNFESKMIRTSITTILMNDDIKIRNQGVFEFYCNMFYWELTNYPNAYVFLIFRNWKTNIYI